MVDFPGGVLKAGQQVIRLQVRKFLDDLGRSHSGGEQVEHVANADAHSTDAGSPAALLRIQSNPRSQIGHAPV